MGNTWPAARQGILSGEGACTEVSIERSDCISCGLCVSTCPDVFRIAEDGLAEVYRQPGPAHLPAVKSAAEGCPVSIIYLEE
ncbi:MAG: ferredoxin [Flavonifractor plautii]